MRPPGNDDCSRNRMSLGAALLLQHLSDSPKCLRREMTVRDRRERHVHQIDLGVRGAGD
jgi:hypothetical protein